jgi:hypothetical protein
MTRGVAAIVSAAHDQMDVGFVSVPVINPDPIQPRSEVVLHLLDEVTSKGSKVLHLGCVVGTDDEPEVMPVITGALGEGTQVGVVRDGVEHPGRLAVVGDALSPEIGEMRPNRTGSAETLSDTIVPAKLSRSAAYGRRAAPCRADGTASNNVQASKIQRSRSRRGTVLYLAIRSAHVLLLPVLSPTTPSDWKGY